MADSYRYNYEEVPSESEGCGNTFLKIFFILFGVVVLLISLGLFMSGNAFGFLLIIGTLFLISSASKKPEKSLDIYNRYFICGYKIIYFSNITDFQINQAAGLLKITYTIDNMTQYITIQRDLFSTDARKSYKIHANREQKFNKVAQRIQREIQRHAPHVLAKGVR